MKKDKLSHEEVAQLLEDFLEGRGNHWAWDDFTQGMSFDELHLEDIRRRCAGLSEEFPPESSSEFCNKAGRDVLRNYIRQLRA